uniref:NYN domain-containing protein n=1 Tax=Noccaea caerulescens TaxID=107243 RepID=A0A1J3JZN9_NOCCA
MAAPRSPCSETCVIWDAGDFKALLPLDTDVYENICEVLGEKGCTPPNTVYVYMDKDSLTNSQARYFENCGFRIIFVPEGNKCARILSMSVDILTDSLNMLMFPINWLIISQDAGENPEFSTAVEVLKEKGFNVIFAQPESILCPFYPSRSSQPKRKRGDTKGIDPPSTIS